WFRLPRPLLCAGLLAMHRCTGARCHNPIQHTRPAPDPGPATASRNGRTGRAGPIDIIFLVERLEALIANGKKLPLTNNVVIEQAEDEASEVRRGADEYAASVLIGLEGDVVRTLQSIKKGIQLLDERRASLRLPEEMDVEDMLPEEEEVLPSRARA